VRGGFNWMMKSVRYFDFDIQSYLTDCLILGTYGNGALKKSDMDELPFTSYNAFMKPMIDKFKKMSGGKKNAK
jgi:hypothetical protein